MAVATGLKSIASRLAPTLVLQCLQNLWSQPAGDEVDSVFTLGRDSNT
jgi:hypothetical protein